MVERSPVHSDFGRAADPGRLRLYLTRRGIARELGRMRDIPRWSRENIEAERDRRLRETVRFAYETVPFYRRTMKERGLRPERIRTLEDMRLLPVIGSEDVRADPLQFLSERSPREHCYEIFTGGSSGVRKRIFHEPVSLMRTRAYGCRDWEVVQQLLREQGHPGRARIRYLSVTSAGSNLLRLEAIRRRLAPRGGNAPTGVAWVDPRWPLTRQIEEINAFEPDILSCYSRTAVHIYREASRRGIALRAPRLFLLHSEGLLPEERRFLEKSAGAPVFMLYSSMEARKIGYECERRDGLHNHEDICPIRLLDEEGRDVAPGVDGRVVISNLLNRGSVFLNLDLGDRGRFATEPCACGRSFHRVHLSQSRMTPPLRIPGEDRLLQFTDVLGCFRELPGLEQFQLIVEAPDRWTFALRFKDPDAVRAAIAPAVERVRRELTGPSIQFDAILTDRAETTAAGKTLPVIFRQADEEGLRIS